MEDMQTLLPIPRAVYQAVKHAGEISVFTNSVIEA